MRGRHYVAHERACEGRRRGGARAASCEIPAGYEQHPLAQLELHLRGLHGRTVEAPPKPRSRRPGRAAEQAHAPPPTPDSRSRRRGVRCSLDSREPRDRSWKLTQSVSPRRRTPCRSICSAPKSSRQPRLERLFEQAKAGLLERLDRHRLGAAAHARPGRAQGAGQDLFAHLLRRAGGAGGLGAAGAAGRRRAGQVRARLSGDRRGQARLGVPPIARQARRDPPVRFWARRVLTDLVRTKHASTSWSACS